jgi:hypothetical protein
MCDICTAKAQRIAELAAFFRAKADETILTNYISRMNETALSLEQLSEYFATRCRCGDDQDRCTNRIVAATDRRLSAMGNRGRHEQAPVA